MQQKETNQPMEKQPSNCMDSEHDPYLLNEHQLSSQFIIPTNSPNIGTLTINHKLNTRFYCRTPAKNWSWSTAKQTKQKGDTRVYRFIPQTPVLRCLTHCYYYPKTLLPTLQQILTCHRCESCSQYAKETILRVHLINQLRKFCSLNMHYIHHKHTFGSATKESWDRRDGVIFQIFHASCLKAFLCNFLKLLYARKPALAIK